MGLKRCKISASGLRIVPIERAHRKERCDLYWYFETSGMRSHAPIIDIEPVITPENDPITQKIIQPQPHRQFDPLGRQVLDNCPGAIGEVNAMEWQPQIARLIGNIDEQGALQPLVNDLRKGKRSRI